MFDAMQQPCNRGGWVSSAGMMASDDTVLWRHLGAPQPPTVRDKFCMVAAHGTSRTGALVPAGSLPQVGGSCQAVRHCSGGHHDCVIYIMGVRSVQNSTTGEMDAHALSGAAPGCWSHTTGQGGPRSSTIVKSLRLQRNMERRHDARRAAGAEHAHCLPDTPAASPSAR